MTGKLEIGFLLFPNLTQLDLTGPYEVFGRLPGGRVHLAWKTLEPVIGDTGMAIMPNTTLDECPQLDVICVPGGPGVNPLLNDDAVLGFLSRQASQAQFITSVCTGALVLGAAGLLEGYKAATHWASMHFLKEFGAIATHARVVADRNRITGGGVSAGIDFGLVVAARLADENVAQRIQLYLEYNPAPPFPAGNPDTAPTEVLSAFNAAANSMLEERALAVKRASTRLARSGST